ncbi:hypothetical protein DE146DRAFT_8964 [Phaeosphaeria sp. MPI-PUGE-AT-0046c]|nr:hypothetical protein DE146DRAFT_8964 [Phaeosphaeria sp. MPI-PUGE-AT-0046c]
MAQRTAEKRSSKPRAHSKAHPNTSISECATHSRTPSPPEPSVPRAPPLSHDMNWLKNMFGKLKMRPKEDISHIVKFARVESPEGELIDVEYFRACLHDFHWTVPPPGQLRKCFTKSFSTALLRNATATNLSGQCFLAFTIPEAKKFLEDENIRINLWNLELCLRVILEGPVADILVQTIVDQHLPVGRELGRTQCLYDQPFPQWIRFITERVFLHPHLSTAAREGLSVLLCRLDLHSSLRLSDAARQRLTSGPWSKKYMKSARMMAKRRLPPRATKTRSPNPSLIPAPTITATHQRELPSLPIDQDRDRDMLSRIYSPDIARQHQKSAQSAGQVTPILQVFRNGAPHSLYATEALLQQDVRDLESRHNDQQAYLRTASTALSNLAEIGSSESSAEPQCLPDIVLLKRHLKFHKFRRSKPDAVPPRSRIMRHRGSPEEQEEALKVLQNSILQLQQRKKLYENEEKWLQESRPRLATVAIPSVEAARRAWEAQQAKSANPRAPDPKTIPSLRGGASQELSQNRDYGATGISSDDPPTYAQSEKERRGLRDYASPSLGNKLSEGL